MSISDEKDKKDAGNEKKKQKINIMKAHGLYGHQCEKHTRAIAKALSQELTKGIMKKCLDCAKGKAKQKNLTKATKEEEDKKDEGRVYLDLSKVLVPPELKFKTRNPN